MTTTEKTQPRLKQRYRAEIKDALNTEFDYANVMQIPGVVKVVVNMGVGDAARDSKLINGAVTDLALITGQKPEIRRARKSIAQFKLREGMPIGARVTLRGDREPGPGADPRLRHSHHQYPGRDVHPAALHAAGDAGEGEAGGVEDVGGEEGPRRVGIAAAALRSRAGICGLCGYVGWIGSVGAHRLASWPRRLGAICAPAAPRRGYSTRIWHGY